MNRHELIGRWVGWVGWVLGLSVVMYAGGSAWGELVFPQAGESMSAENRAILDPWTGQWQGEFVVYAVDGSVLTRLQVRQRYWWDGDIQRAEFHETNEKGEVVTAVAANYEDDQGRLVCTVEKSNGERSLHFGKMSDGYLFWSADRPGVTETFRERVEGQGAGAAYAINGLGVYGGTPFLFYGWYTRPTEAAETQAGE
ncbi:MAG: hypothetical protein AAF797_17285 [Planctomycetota bacterium]